MIKTLSFFISNHEFDSDSSRKLLVHVLTYKIISLSSKKNKNKFINDTVSNYYYFYINPFIFIIVIFLTDPSFSSYYTIT